MMSSLQILACKFTLHSQPFASMSFAYSIGRLLLLSRQTNRLIIFAVNEVFDLPMLRSLYQCNCLVLTIEVTVRLTVELKLFSTMVGRVL